MEVKYNLMPSFFIWHGDTMALPRFVTNPLGHAAAAVGRTYDYLTPGAGTSSLTQAGRNAADVRTDVYGNPLRVGDARPLSGANYTPGYGTPTGGQGHVQALVTNQPNHPYGESGSGGSNPETQAALFQYEQGINQGNDALGHIDSQLNTGIANLGGQYNSAYNRLLGQKAVAQRDYETNKGQQLQDYQGARENVANNTRNLLLNTRRLLGAQGAGGGSADRYAAPNAAQQVGSAENAVVQKTNARNIAALDTSYGDNERQIGGAIEDLNMQKDQSERGLRSQFEQQRADILNNIAMLTGQRAIAKGQNLQQAQAAASPFTSRIQGILGNIDNLAANPAVLRAREVQLARPDLAQYQYNRFDAPTVAAQDPTLVHPAVAALLGLDQDQRQQLA